MEEAEELTVYLQTVPDSRRRIKIWSLGVTGCPRVRVPGKRDLGSSLFRLRSWTSSGSSCHSSSSQPERGPSPSLLSTISLDTMPKFAFSSEDEGAGPAPVGPKRPVFILGEPDPPPPAATPVMPKSSTLSGRWDPAGEGWCCGKFPRGRTI